VARILIVGGGCRGLRLSELMVERGHAVRATSRRESRRAAIESTGAECWIGTPDRLATLRGALENVTVACWMLACARGDEHELSALHSSRLEFFLGQAIDTTARGLIYDAWPIRTTDGSPRSPSAEMLAEGARTFRSLTELNAIPAVVLGGRESADAGDDGGGWGSDGGGWGSDDTAWLAAACDAVAALLGGAR
jgi:hypothetical protein